MAKEAPCKYRNLRLNGSVAYHTPKRDIKTLAKAIATTGAIPTSKADFAYEAETEESGEELGAALAGGLDVGLGVVLGVGVALEEEHWSELADPEALDCGIHPRPDADG